MIEYRHQTRALKWLAQPSHGRALVAMDQGLGKTYCAITDAQARGDAAYPLLVICPAHAKLVWRDEFTQWAPGRSLQIIQTDGFFADDVDVWIINYDVLRRTYLPLDAKTLVVDECHYIANREAARTRKIAAYARGDHAPRTQRYLSGTPMQRPIDLYVPMTLCGATRLAWIDFGKRYAAGFQDEHGGWDMRGSSHVDELAAKLAPMMFRVTKKEALPDLPAKLWKIIALDLPIDERERDYSLEAILACGSPIPFEGLSEILRMQSERKLAQCIDFIDDMLVSEQKVIVFAWHRETIARLAEHFASEGVVTLNGDTPQNQRGAAVTRFQTDPAVRLFVGNIDAAGTAITLTAASVVVFVEGSWNPNKMEQCADRAHRIGQTRPVRCFVLTVDQSIDHAMVRRCLEKLRVINRVILSTQESPMQNDLKAFAIALGEALFSFAGQIQTATPAADPAPAAAGKTTKAKATTAPTKADPPAMTADEMRQRVVTFIKGVKGDTQEQQLRRKETVLGIIKKFGADKVDQLVVAAYGAVAAELDAQANAAPAAADLDI